MKVVLFCGGLGTRLREHSDTIPKPLVSIGHRPVVWHLMKYYSHFGFKQFVLCLGYRGDLIKEYFLNYREWMSNDFTLRNTTFMTWNLLHFARMLNDAGGIPVYGNGVSAWNAGQRFGAKLPRPFEATS